MLNTVTARQIQKNYKKIFDHVKETQTPVIVISNSKPTVAIVSLDFLDKVEPTNLLRQLELEAIEEHEEGRTKIINTPEDLEKDLEELEIYANKT